METIRWNWNGSTTPRRTIIPLVGQFACHDVFLPSSSTSHSRRPKHFHLPTRPTSAEQQPHYDHRIFFKLARFLASCVAGSITTKIGLKPTQTQSSTDKFSLTVLFCLQISKRPSPGPSHRSVRVLPFPLLSMVCNVQGTDGPLPSLI